MTYDDLHTVARIVLSFQRVPLGTSNKLLASLWLYRNRLATLEHDKVYGILGLLTSEDNTVQPDYRKPFEDVCRSLVRDNIKTSGNLHALKGIRAARSLRAPTSWSTDWSNLAYWAEDQSRVLTELYKRLYTASASHTARIATPRGPPENFDFLSVAGRIVDRVEYVHQERLSFRSDIICAPSTKKLENLLAVLRELRKYREDGSYIAGGTAFSAFWRTLIGDCILPYRESQNLFDNLRAANGDTYEPSIRRAKPIDFMAFILWQVYVVHYAHICLLTWVGMLKWCKFYVDHIKQPLVPKSARFIITREQILTRTSGRLGGSANTEGVFYVNA
jgi:hypothetical protein